MDDILCHYALPNRGNTKEYSFLDPNKMMANEVKKKIENNSYLNLKYHEQELNTLTQHNT